MSNQLKTSIFTLGIFFAVMLITQFAGLGGSVKLNPQLSLPDVMAVLTSFMVLTLVVERFADVVITVPIEFNKLTLLKSIEAKKETNEEHLELVSQLNKYRAETRTSTTRLNLFLGLIIGLAGYRILSALSGSSDSFNPIEDLGERQLLIYHTVDIVLTAGLIAGGSKGINVISKSMRDWFKASRQT